MTYDNFNQQLISVRYGEKRPIFGTITGDSGIESLSSPKFTLLDATGQVIIDRDTAQASAPGLSTQVYYNLDTLLAPTTPLTPGTWYYAYFDTVDVASGDGITRNLRPTLAIWVAPLVEATYVIGSPIGQVRLAISDTNVVDPVFSDPELLDFLTRGGGDINLAASKALISQATDRAKLAISMNDSSWGTTQTEVYKALMSLAEVYGKVTIAPVYVPKTKAIFTIGNSDLGTVGTMDNW